ncbi:MAG: indolepyruvate oxidoreductase [Deltaproteobacteria bacterium]|nr:MAG: indolepyruvate oxidoreductase [Deltaproteobacteria bacterium]
MKRVLLGNEAMAWGILEGGATVVTSYPGTPASEILQTVHLLKEEHRLRIHVEWSVNEKVAFEVALTNSYLGRRSAVAMKQVGLNVALDPLMSAAYTGVKGGFVIISADDPGPYSSQTEQDSRYLASFAKVPVFDPSCPEEAKEMVKRAFELSERYELPVMVRPTSWICHARQGVSLGKIEPVDRSPSFEKAPERWAATPRFRYLLHRELNEKIRDIASRNAPKPIFLSERAELAVIASGVPYAHAHDVIEAMGLEGRVALYKVDLPYPLDHHVEEIVRRYPQTLILEETYPLMELQVGYREGLRGKLDLTVPSEGELTPDEVARILLGLLGGEVPRKEALPGGGRRPSLCPGCPHRATFWAIRKAAPQGIYPSDIGCYTLGVNLKAVDTCLCMGASISQAAGLYHSFRSAGKTPPSIVATIGDSTFFHSGVPALINAVHQGASFVLVILDNGTVAMTGGQPTPATDGPGKRVEIEDLVSACGVDFMRVVDPYRVPELIQTIKEADRFAREGRGVAVVIARAPCLIYGKREREQGEVIIADDCTHCGLCTEKFECPALVKGPEGRPRIDRALCTNCGLCLFVCPQGAIRRVEA